MIYGPEHKEFINSLTKFIEQEINPYVDAWEEDGIFPAHKLFKKMGDQGFLGVCKPEKYGGMGLDYSFSLAMSETLGKNQLWRRTYGYWRTNRHGNSSPCTFWIRIY